MTTILITPKDSDRKNILSELAVKKAEKYGGFICCNDIDSEIRSAFENCTEYPVIIYPINIAGDADLNRIADKCRQGFDMAVFSVGDGTGCIAALNRLPRSPVTSSELYSSAAAANFSIADVPCGGYITEVTDSESYHKLITDILFGRFTPDIPFDRKIFRPPFPGTADFKGEYPMYIGQNCHFGDNVTVTSGSCIGDNVYIGNNVKIVSSVITGGSYIHDNSIIENTVTGYAAPASPHILGTDGSTGASVSLSSAFAAGQALCGIKTAFAYNASGETAAQAFSAGYVYSGGDICNMGAVPENVFRYGLNTGDYGCGVYFGDGYVRIWGGDGFPSDEMLRRRFETAMNSAKVKPVTVKKGSCVKYDGLYKTYNREISKLIVSDVGGIFADVTVPDKALYRLCRAFTQVHHMHCRDNMRIAFHISGDGSRISAYTDEIGYVFHDRLVMLCLYYGNYSKTSVYSFFPHIDIKDGKEKNIELNRFEYAPNSAEMTADELYADKKARQNADIFLFDGVSIMAKVLNILAEKHLTLRQAISPLPVYSSANRMITSQESTRSLFRRLGLPAAGGKADVSSHKAYLRPLRTGGIILSAESSSLESASEICDFFEEIINKSKD